MKTILKFTTLTAVLLILANIGLYAQQSNVQQNGTFSIGGRVGLAVGYSNRYSQCALYGDLTHDMVQCGGDKAIRNPGVNFNITLYGNYALNNRFSLQTELNFMRYHAHGKIALAKLNYYSLDIPLLAKVNLLGSRRFSLGLLAGPHIFVPLGKADFHVTFPGREFQEKLSINNFAVFGFTAGLFCKIKVGRGRIVGDFRFARDFERLKFEGVIMPNQPHNRPDIRFTPTVIQRLTQIISLGYELSF